MIDNLLIPVGSLVLINDKKGEYLIVKNYIKDDNKLYLCTPIEEKEVNIVEVEEEKIKKVLFLGFQRN